jgi:hypothetical protein
MSTMVGCKSTAKGDLWRYSREAAIGTHVLESLLIVSFLLTHKHHERRRNSEKTDWTDGMRSEGYYHKSSLSVLV